MAAAQSVASEAKWNRRSEVERLEIERRGREAAQDGKKEAIWQREKQTAELDYVGEKLCEFAYLEDLKNLQCWANSYNKDWRKKTSFRTPLIEAAACISLRHDVVAGMVQHLLHIGASVQLREIYGKSALHWAAITGNTAVLQLLLAAPEAEIDSMDLNGDTPLMLAAQHDKPAAIRVLLMWNADPHLRNGNGNTAMSLALGIKSEEALQSLLPPSHRHPSQGLCLVLFIGACHLQWRTQLLRAVDEIRTAFSPLRFKVVAHHALSDGDNVRRLIRETGHGAEQHHVAFTCFLLCDSSSHLSNSLHPSHLTEELNSHTATYLRGKPKIFFFVQCCWMQQQQLWCPDEKEFLVCNVTAKKTESFNFEFVRTLCVEFRQARAQRHSLDLRQILNSTRKMQRLLEKKPMKIRSTMTGRLLLHSCWEENDFWEREGSSSEERSALADDTHKH